MTRRPFHLMALELLFRTEDKRPNTVTKDVSIALITPEIHKGLGTVSRELGEDQICEKYTLVI